MTRVHRFRFDQHSLGIVALFCAGIFPAVLMWHAMVTNWVPLPFWDEWFTPGNQLASWCKGTLTLKELFSQHNESRKFFPRLLYLALARLHGWDVRDAMLVTFASFCAMSALLYRTLRLTPRASTVSALIAWTVMSFLCFAPVQFDNFLLGSQFEPFFPGLAVLAAANVNLSQRPFGAKIFANIVLAVLATYTFANGMILWLLAIPLPSVNHRTTVSRCLLFYGIYAICAMVAVGGYFVGYARPSYHPSLTVSPSRFIDLGHYFILWVGAYFDSPIIGAFRAGCFVFLIGVAVMTKLGITIWRSHEWRWCYPWLLLASYAVITGVTTAVGRLGFGLTQALEARYTVFSLCFYVAAIGAAHALYCRFAETDEGKAPRNLLVMAVLLMTLMMPAWSASYRERRGHLSLLHLRNRRLLRALEWIDVIPSNSDLALIFPYVDWLKGNVDILARAGVLRLPFVHGALAAAVQQLPHADDFTHGRIDAVKIEREQNLVVTGWAWLPERNHPPDCVVFGGERVDATFQLLGVVEPGGSSKEIAKQFHNRRMTHVAFWAGSNLERIPAGKLRIGAWAVDIESGRARPIHADPNVGVVEWRTTSD